MGATSAVLVSTLVVIIIAGSISLYIGKIKKGSENWEVAGRSLPWYVIVGTQFASAVGGGLLVAHLGIGYSSGWSALTYGVNRHSSFTNTCTMAKTTGIHDTS